MLSPADARTKNDTNFISPCEQTQQELILLIISDSKVKLTKNKNYYCYFLEAVLFIKQKFSSLSDWLVKKTFFNLSARRI